MSKRQIVVHPGQKVVTTEGRTETVAYMLRDIVYVHSVGGWLKAVRIVGDAWGGEADQTQGLAA